MAIIVIIASIAVPSFREMILDNRRAAVVNELRASLLLAASESSKRGRDISVCARKSAGVCGSTSDWSNGWITFENVDDDVPPVIDAGEAIIRDTAYEADYFKAQANVAGVTVRPFNRRSTNGTIIYCDSREGDETRAVVQAFTGRSRIAKTKSDGTTYSCS
ncbi:hypothetical protein GYB61_07790 [bacterium]|nr:hypothetical protein [bacterium]